MGAVAAMWTGFTPPSARLASRTPAHTPQYTPAHPMRTAQLLLAGATCVLLAACGTSTVTSPDATPPAAPHRDGIDHTTTTTASECQGTLVITVDADGNLVTQCVIEARQGGGGN